MKLTPFQKLFFKQELFFGHSKTNLLEGNASFNSEISFKRLSNALFSVLNEAEWTYLKINLSLEQWEKTSEFNGSLEILQSGQKPVKFYEPIDIDDKLWAVVLIQHEKFTELKVKFHHCLADAHSFALFWETFRKRYLNIEDKVLKINYKENNLDGLEFYDLPFTPDDFGLGPVKRVYYHFNKRRIDKIKKICEERKTDFQTLLLYALQLLNNKVQSTLGYKLLTGVPLKNRPSKSDKLSFLCCINFLPLSQNQYSDVEELRKNLRIIFKNQSYPLLDWLKEKKREKAFNVLFSYQKENYDLNWGEHANSTLTFLPSSLDENLFGLHVLDYNGVEGLTIAYDIRTDIQSTYFWKKCLEYYIELLIHWGIYGNWDYQFKIQDARLLPEENNFVNFWDAYNAVPDNKPAIFFEGKSYSFGEFKVKVNTKSQEYVENKNDIIYLKPIRSVETLVNILAIWSVGKTVAFDERDEALEKNELLQLISESYPKQKIPENLYLAKTSGTSGTHKEILIGSRGICHLMYEWKKQYKSDSSSVHLSIADLRFDVFMGDIFRSILTGQTLVLASESERYSSLDIVKLINIYSVTHFECTPSMISTFTEHLERLSSLKVLICGSELLTPSFASILRKKLHKNTALFNSYGLTECSIDSCCFEINADFEDIVPVGKPMSGQFFEVRKDSEIVPFGVWGELYIGGSTVGKPVNFQDGFFEKNNINYYKTGDEAMILPLFGLIIKGRLNEDFVKVNGRRVPVSPIKKYLSSELNLLQSELFKIDERAILFVKKNDLTAELVKDTLSNYFSSYQMPDDILLLQEWPINKNGKTDRNELNACYQRYFSTDIKWEPKNELEQIVFRCISKIGKPYGSEDQKLTKFGWTSIDFIKLANELTLNGILVSANLLLKEPTLNTILSADHKIKTEKVRSVQLSGDDLDDILSILNS